MHARTPTQASPADWTSPPCTSPRCAAPGRRPPGVATSAPAATPRYVLPGRPRRLLAARFAGTCKRTRPSLAPRSSLQRRHQGALPDRTTSLSATARAARACNAAKAAAIGRRSSVAALPVSDKRGHQTRADDMARSSGQMARKDADDQQPPPRPATAAFTSRGRRRPLPDSREGVA
jgi:hypothetical protein